MTTDDMVVDFGFCQWFYDAETATEEQILLRRSIDSINVAVNFSAGASLKCWAKVKQFSVFQLVFKSRQLEDVYVRRAVIVVRDENY